MNKKTLLLVATILLGVAACKETAKQSQSEEPKAVDTPKTESRDAVVRENVFKRYADSVLSIGHLLQADVVVWPEIYEKYKLIKPLVKRTDRGNATNYAEEIPKALADIKANKLVDVNRHLVTKGLQHVTVLIISDLIDRTITGEPRSIGTTAANIETVFAAIQPTLARRDATVYDGKATLVPLAQEALARLKSADSKVSLAGAVMNFSALLSRTYALSVLFEMKGVEEFCAGTNANPEKCAIKRTEARIYYRIIVKSVEAQDKETSGSIEKMINSEHAVPKYTTVRDLLAKSLPLSVEDLTF